MKKTKTVNWFQGNVNGGVRSSGSDHYGMSVEDLLRVKSKSEIEAERSARRMRTSAMDECPIKRIVSWKMTEARKNEILSRYGLGDESSRRSYQKKVAGR